MVKERPNVLLITADHWPAKLLGCANDSSILTPTIDVLAMNGVRFSNAYTECPICVPARRSIMTGLSPRGHGDRTFDEDQPLPDCQTLAGAFREAGYQTYAVGKLHVNPQRARIGFDDVLLDEEGRVHKGVTDDYSIFLGDMGYPGRQFSHGMGTNDYSYRPWHLPEQLHVTNWAAESMSRVIRRRDPTRPGFWYLSFRHPHPPLVPLESYLKLYEHTRLDAVIVGDWAADDEALPLALRGKRARANLFKDQKLDGGRRAFLALCTHIDHQIRLVIGTLREEGILENTVIMFTSDHGDMLGEHGLLMKSVFYESSANVPMIVVEPAGNASGPSGRVDDRLVGLQDIMPTLLQAAGIEMPAHVEGVSMLDGSRRDVLIGEFSEGSIASRMVHDGKHKLIYYPAGSRTQLFDLEKDPNEISDLSKDVLYADVKQRLADILVSYAYGRDLEWVKDGKLVGFNPPATEFVPGRDLTNQRGSHWPTPPVSREKMKALDG